MGNTPSQGGFHNPDSVEQAGSQVQHQHDINSQRNHRSQQPPDASLDNIIVRERPVSADPAEQRNFHGNGFASNANIHLSPNTSSVPLHFGRDSIKSAMDQPYSMDSLAIDRSSVNSTDLEPSSLSPSPETASHEPLGHLTVSNENVHHQKHKTLSGLTKPEFSDHIDPADVVQYADSMQNQFDSLEEPFTSVDDNSLSSPSSSFLNSNELYSFQVETGVDIVTVNGLTVPPDYSGMFPKCLKKEKQFPSFTSCVIENDTLGDTLEVDSKNIVHSSSTSSDGMTSASADKELSCKTIVPQQTTSGNETVYINGNKSDLAGSACTEPTFNCLEKCTPIDLRIAKSTSINSETYLVEIHGETKSESDKCFTEGQNSSDCNPEKSDTDNNTVAFLPGSETMSEEAKLFKGYDYDSVNVNKDRKVGPVYPEIDNISECTQRKENQFDETVVVSNLIFVEGSNNEDGQLFTQVCLQSSEIPANVLKPKVKHTHETILGIKPQKMNNADKVFQNESFPNYNMRNVDINTEVGHVGNDIQEKFLGDSGTKNIEQSKIMSLVLSANRPQFPDPEMKTENTVPPVMQEICESWDDIQPNIEETKAVVIPYETPPIIGDFTSECKITPAFEPDDMNNFNRSVHRESLADFERFEAEISKLEGLKLLTSVNTSEAKMVSTDPNNTFSPSDIKSLCANDSNKSPSLDTLKEGLDYEEMMFTTKEAINNEHDRDSKALEGPYHKSHDREIEEQSINFHKESTANNVINVNEILTTEMLPVNAESIVSQNYSGATGKTNQNSVEDVIIDVEQDGKPLNSLLEINETKNALPKITRERPKIVNKSDKVHPHLDISFHSFHSCPSANNPNPGNTEDSPKTTVPHISKVYMSTDSDQLQSPITVAHATITNPATAEQIICSEPKSVHFETDHFNTRNKLEEVIEQDDFFIDISGSQKEKSRSMKKFSKPPRLSSNFRKSAILKRKESNNDDTFPSVEIFDGSSCRINNSVTDRENSKPSREKVSKLELKAEESKLNNINGKTFLSEASVIEGSVTCDKMDITRTLFNIHSDQSGLKSEINNRSPSSASEEHNKDTGIYETAWSSSSEDMVTVLKKRSSSIVSGQNNENVSISSGDCSMVFLPLSQSTPNNQILNTTDAIFEEIRKKIKTDENGNLSKIWPSESSMQNAPRPFQPSISRLNFKKSDDNLMSSGVGVGIDKDRTYNFSENHSKIENRSSMPENHEESSHLDKTLLSGHRGNIMSPSLSNEFMVMNGVTEGHTDTDDISITPVEEALAAQEENFSRQLQEKENYINELQNNLESLKLKSDSDTDYTRVLAQYEKTMSINIQKIDEMTQQLQESENDKVDLIKERDQALEDLRNVESAFSDVHRKYERAKGLLENLKINEDTLIQRDQELIQKVQNRDMKIEALKEKAQDSLEQMHMDYENRIRDMEAENTKLRAQYRMMEMKLESAERDVEQKAKENAQLSALCDELINGQVIN